jgi:hypothetical protein
MRPKPVILCPPFTQRMGAAWSFSFPVARGGKRNILPPHCPKKPPVRTKREMICCAQGKVAHFGTFDLGAAPTGQNTCHILCPHRTHFQKRPNNLKHLQRLPVHHLRPQHKESKQDHLTQQRIAKNAKKSHRGCENTSLECSYLHSTHKSLRTHHSEGAGSQTQFHQKCPNPDDLCPPGHA